MYSIRLCTVDEVLSSATELFNEHWKEICTNKEIMKLNPDAEKYRIMEDSGFIVCIGAFSNDKLIGYSVNILGNQLHYADVKCMSNDLLFVAADYRKTPVGLRLIKATENHAKQLGVDVMDWHAKPGTTLDKILQRKGYKTQDIIYRKKV